MNVNLSTMEMVDLIAIVEITSERMGKREAYKNICLELRKSIGAE